MSTHPHETGFDIRTAPPLVQWRSWPFATRYRHTAGVATVLFLVAAIVSWETGAVGWGMVAAAVIAMALWRSILPVRFELNANGLTEHSWGRKRRIPWASIRRYELLPRGVVIFPASSPAPLDTLRSLYVPWDDHREEVLAQFRYYLGSPACGT